MTIKCNAIVAAFTMALAGACGLAEGAIPQSGLWIVDAEANGKPGRGFQIDLQNQTLVFTYYGYKLGGAPTFYLASGTLSDAGVFDGQLIEYQGGTSLGGPHLSATANASAGAVNVRFASPTAGTITFPGEVEKSISRFSVADTSTRFKRTVYDGIAYGVGPFANDSTDFTFVLANGDLTLTRASFFSGTCLFSGRYTLAGAALQSTGTYKCSDFSEGTYRAEALQVDEHGVYTGVFYRKKAGASTESKEIHSGR